MLGRLRETLRQRPPVGACISLAIHLLLIALIVGDNPARTTHQKKGDALIVELPKLDEPANAGTPGPQADAPLLPAAPPQRASAPPAPPKPSVPAKPAPPAEKPIPREAPRAVANAPKPAPAERGDIPLPKPTPQSAPRETPDTSRTPESVRPDPSVANAPPSPPGQVAMVPPAAPDLRSAFSRGGGGGGIGSGGAGGRGFGRGGIAGEPIPLDSKDADFTDYLERIKRQIKQNWVFPCIKDRETGYCEYKSTELIVEFGILKPGQLQYIEVRRASPWQIYDDFAVNAVKLASPFPPVPAALMARMDAGSTGTKIVARFVYHFESGFTNVLR
jgi:outer membrane biosynthesis protein TonB